MAENTANLNTSPTPLEKRRAGDTAHRRSDKGLEAPPATYQDIRGSVGRISEYPDIRKKAYSGELKCA